MASENLDDVGGTGYVPVHTKDIVHNLVESYKQKKSSTQDLLRDPIFLSLPATKQLEVVQSYSGIMADGGIPPNIPKILLKALRSGATTGLIAALPISILMKTMPGRVMIGGMGAVTGAGLGLVGGILTAKGEKDRYETTNKYLVQLSKNKEVPTALKILDVNRNYEPRTLSAIIRRMESPEKAIIEKAVGMHGPKLRERLITEIPEVYK